MSEILADNRSAAAPVPWRLVPRTTSQENASRAAELELEARIEQARREGVEAGLASGRAQVQQQLPSTLQNISESLAELAQIRERLRRTAERDLVRLVLTLAARVIHRETVVDPDATAGLIKAAFLKVQSRDVSRVRMHPAIEPVVTKTLEGCGATGLVLMPDANLKSGELLFETSQGVLDASVSTQLAEIERGLSEQLGTSGASSIGS